MNIIEKTLLDLEKYINNNGKDYPLSNIETVLRNTIENDGLLIEKLLSRYFEHIKYRKKDLVNISIALLHTGLYNSEIEKIYYNLSLTSHLTSLSRVEQKKLVCYFSGGIYGRNFKNIISFEKILHGAGRVKFLYECLKYNIDFSSNDFNTHVMNGINSRKLIDMPNKALSFYVSTLYQYNLISLTIPIYNIADYPIDKSITILAALISLDINETETDKNYFYNSLMVSHLFKVVLSNEDFTENAIKLIKEAELPLKSEIYLKAQLYKFLVVKAVEQNVIIQDCHIDNYLNVFLSKINYPLKHLNILKKSLKESDVLQITPAKNFMNLLYKKLDYLPILEEQDELHNIISNDIIVKNKTKRL